MWLRRLNLGLETVARNSFHAVRLPWMPLGEEARCDAEPMSRSLAVATFTKLLAGFSLWTRSFAHRRGCLPDCDQAQRIDGIYAQEMAKRYARRRCEVRSIWLGTAYEHPMRCGPNLTA
jgi:hypothetical protein